MTPYQQYIALSRYARYLPEKNRRESWEETVSRYCEYFSKISDDFPKEDAFNCIKNFDVMPSMRALMTAGKALDRDEIAGFNCSYLAVDDIRAFDEALYILMNGVGLGFSVERQFVAQLPEVAEYFFESDTIIKVKDSKIGWATSFRELIGMLYGGKIPKWDLSELRPAGAPLKIFGGRSSGSAPLNELFEFAVKLFKNAAGRKLNSLECHDLMCQIANIVVVGGVRRCLPSGSKVHTKFGMINIEDIEIGDEVLTSSGYNKVSNKFDQGLQSLVRVKTQDSYFDCTPNHKIAVLSGTDSYIWKQAKDLTVDDYLIAPSVAIEGIELSKLTNVDSKTFNLNAVRITEKIGDNLERIPDFMWKAKKDIKLSYIYGLIDNITPPLLWYNTYSDLEKAREIQLLLSSCGIQSRISKASSKIVSDNEQEKYIVELVPVDAKLIPVAVTGIDYLEEQKQTWDIEVEEAHEFFCNGYLMHNSALISLSNLSDDRIKHAKTGQWWIINPQRALSNNSAAYTEKPNISQFMDEWVNLYESKSGERGIFNRVAAKKKIKSLNGRRKPDFDFGVNPCLTGETLVYVADGRGEVSIKQLQEEGKDVDVFCFDDKQNIVIRTLRNPRITGYDMPVYKMTLDDGSVIRATENHKFLTKNDGYKELKNLIVGDSLNIITKFESSIQEMMPNGATNTKKYLWLTKNGNTNYLEHRIIAEHMNNGSIPPGYVVHHKNHNSKDNSVNNLQIMSKVDHDRLHGDLMFGENNPMVRAKTEWSEEKWDLYKKNLSDAVAGDLNGRYSGISNNELKKHALFLTKQLNRRFSANDWSEYAKKNNLPQHFSKWREDHLGGILGLAKSCALELGIDHIDIDPRIVATYKKVVDEGYDAEIIDGNVVVHKKCEICGKPFIAPYDRREFGVCSKACSAKKTWQSEDRRESFKDSIKAHYDEKRKNTRELQTKVYSDLKFQLGRDPQKLEWVAKCKELNVSYEISRKSSPFVSYNQLKEAASLYNHKVVSIEFDDYETVYNGTVDQYHNFFVGGFNGSLPNEKKKTIYINNLNCGEIILRSHQTCNLSEVIIRENDTLDDLLKKVEMATILGTFQATLTNYRYLRSIWKKNNEEERLLGVSLTGIMDHPILSHVTDEAKEWLIKMREHSIQVNKEWAKKLNINPSAAITTCKPSGTVSQLVDSSSGMHPRMSKFYIRTVRNDKKDPLSDFLIKEGVPYEKDVTKDSNWVFSFPMKSPSHCRLASEMTAIEQLEHYLMFNIYWTEHNPSITVYVREHEWLDVAAWVYKNFDHINGVSFLPYSDSIYKQAPYQPITEEEYLKMMEKFPDVDFSRFNVNEYEDNTVGTQTLACVGNVCELR